MELNNREIAIIIYSSIFLVLYCIHLFLISKEERNNKILSIIKICKIKELRIFIFKNFIKKIYNMKI